MKTLKKKKAKLFFLEFYVFIMVISTNEYSLKQM